MAVTLPPEITGGPFTVRRIAQCQRPEHATGLHVWEAEEDVLHHPACQYIVEQSNLTGRLNVRKVVWEGKP